MAGLRKVDYDPFADEEADVPETEPASAASAPSTSPPRDEPEPVEPDDEQPPTTPQPSPARPRSTGSKRVGYNPFGETAPKGDGSYLTEIPKGVAAGTVGTTGTMLKGMGATRQADITTRAQEKARAGVLPQEELWPGEVTPITPELRQKLTAATKGVPIPDVTQDPFYQAGLATQKWSDDTFKAAHDFEDSWTRKISEGLGSTLPFLAANLVPGFGAVGTVAGGSMISAGEAVDRAIQAGAKPEQILSAIQLGALPGFTEQLPMEVIFERVPLPQWGKLLGYVTKVGAKAFAEGGQEAFQQFAQNLIANYVYKPDQDLMEGVVEAGAIGAAVGGIIAAPTTRGGRKADETPDTADDAEPEGVPGEPQAVVQPQGPGGRGETPAAPQNVPATVTVEAGKEKVAGEGAKVSTTAVDPDAAAALGAPVVPDTTDEEEEEVAETEFDAGEGVSSAMAAAVQAARGQRDAAAAARAPIVTTVTGTDPANEAALTAKPKRQRKPKAPEAPPLGTEPTTAVTPVTAEPAGTPEAAARRAAGTAPPDVPTTPVQQEAAGVAGAPQREAPAAAPAVPAPVFEQPGLRSWKDIEDEAVAREAAPAPPMPRQAEGFQIAPEISREAPTTRSPLADLLARSRGETAPAATPVAEETVQPPVEPVVETVATPEVVPDTTEKLPPKVKEVVQKAKAKAKPKPEPKPRPEKTLTLPEKAKAAVEKAKAKAKPRVEEAKPVEIKAAEKGKTVSKGEARVEEVRRRVEAAEKKIREERKAEPVLGEQAPVRQVTPHAEALADAIKAEMVKQDKDIFSRGDAHEMADKVAAQFTAGVDEKTSTSKIISERLQAGVAQVESRLNKRAAEEEKTKAAEEETKHERARQVKTERRVSGAPEDRARAKEGGRAKQSAEVASEHIEKAAKKKSLIEHGKREKGEPHIPEYAEMGELYGIRKVTPIKQKPDITRQIKAKHQALVERLAREEKEAAPAEEAETKPSEAEVEAKTKSGPERWSYVDPVIQEAIKPLQAALLPGEVRTMLQMRQQKYGLPAMLRTFIKQVQDGLRELSKREGVEFKLHDRIDPKKNSPAENFVAYAKAIAFERRRGVEGFDIWQALEFLRNGKTDDFTAMIGDTQLTANKDFISLTGKQGEQRGVVLGDDIAYLAHRDMSEEELEDLDELRKLEEAAKPQYTAQDPYFTTDFGEKRVAMRLPNGQEVSVPYSNRSSARAALEGARAGLEEEFGDTVYSTIRNFLHKRLIKLVGDIDVVYASQSQLNFLAGSTGVQGLYYNPGTRAQLSGWKPMVLISNEVFHSASPEAYHHTLTHELVHAATVYALETDLNGTRDVIQQLRDELEQQLKRSGVWEKFPRSTWYGLTTDSNAEFIAEVFTNETLQRVMSETTIRQAPRSTLNALLKKIPMPTWMQAFTKAVSNALGTWSPMERAGNNYLEQVIRLYPTVFQSVEEQVQSMRENPLKRRVAALRESVAPKDPWDVEFYAHQTQQNADAVREAAEREPFNTRANKRWYGLSTSMEIRRRAERWFGPDSAIFGLIDALLSGRKDFENERRPGAELTAELARYADANPAVYREMEDIGHDATVNELNPWDALGTGRNSHIKVKKGKLKLHLVPAFRDLNTRVSKLPQKAQDLLRKLDRHYADQHDRNVRITVEQIIADAVENLKVKLPAGVSQADAAAWVLDGRIDRPAPKDPANPTANERTQYDQDLHDALKNTAKTLQGSKNMRKIKGFYVPLMRQGKYFFTATKHLDTAALAKLGGIVDTAKGRENQILFPNEADYLDFVKNKKPADMHINDVTVDHVDPNTGLPTWPDGKKVSAKDANAVSIYRVHVQNRAMEMNDSDRALKKLQRQYHADGYEVTGIDEVDKIQHSSSALLPTQVNALLRSIEQASGDNAGLKQRAIQGAVVSAYHRQLSGNRAAHRRLKRQNVRGYARNLIHAMDTTNRTMAGHIMNLIKAPKIAKLDAALAEEMRSSRYAGKGGQLARRGIVNEIRKRIAAAGTRSEHYWGASVIRNAMALSFLSHLATPAYVFANLTQPFATTWGVLASHWKGGRGGVLGELTKAYWDLGAGRIMGRGLIETGRQAWDVGKRFSRTPYDFHQRTRNQMARMPQGPLFTQAMDLLEQLGLSAESGTELPEVSELGMNVASRTLNRIAEVSRTLPTAAEAVNRYVTLMVAIRLAKRGGMSDEKAIQYAVSMVEKTQGGYAAENNPNFFSGKYTRAPLQFKKYAELYGQLYYGALMDMGIGQDRATRVQAAKQLIRMSASAVVLSGVGGIAVMEIAKIGVMVAALLGIGDDDWEDWENGMQEWFGEMLKYVGGGEASAEALMHGASRFLQFDTSSRLGNDNMVFFGEPQKYDEANTKAWALDMAIGAPGGMVSDALQAVNNNDWEKAALKLLPKMFTDLKKAYDQSQEGVVTKTGKQVVKPTSNLETFWQALGFRPASIARQFEAGGGGAQYKKEKRSSEARTAVMQIYRNAPAHQRQKIFRNEIARWNRAHPDQRIDMGDLRKSLARKKSEEKKARKREYAQ